MSLSESTHYTFSQVSEAVSFLRSLSLSDEIWCEDIRTAVSQALQNATFASALEAGDSRSVEVREQMALAAVMVMGGNFETLRIGGRVSLSHTDLTATVLSLKCDMSTSSGLLFASNADVALILVDARKGVLTQTRRHSIICSALGIKNIVLAVNKMDLVDYSSKIFKEIEIDYLDFVHKLNFSTISLIISKFTVSPVKAPSKSTMCKFLKP